MGVFMGPYRGLMGLMGSGPSLDGPCHPCHPSPWICPCSDGASTCAGDGRVGDSWGIGSSRGIGSKLGQIHFCTDCTVYWVYTVFMYFLVGGFIFRECSVPTWKGESHWNMLESWDQLEPRSACILPWLCRACARVQANRAEEISAGVDWENQEISEPESHLVKPIFHPLHPTSRMKDVPKRSNHFMTILHLRSSCNLIHVDRGQCAQRRLQRPRGRWWSPLRPGGSRTALVSSAAWFLPSSSHRISMSQLSHHHLSNHHPL